MRDADSSPEFSREARRALTLAQEEATYLNHWLIGTEHLTLALIGQNGDLGDMLGGYGITLVQARAKVLEIRRPVGSIGKASLAALKSTVVQLIQGDTLLLEDIGLTQRAKAAIDRAAREAQALNMDVGPAHILLGVLGVADGIGIGVLIECGADPRQLEVQVRSLLVSSA